MNSSKRVLARGPRPWKQANSFEAPPAQENRKLHTENNNLMCRVMELRTALAEEKGRLAEEKKRQMKAMGKKHSKELKTAIEETKQSVLQDIRAYSIKTSIEPSLGKGSQGNPTTPIRDDYGLLGLIRHYWEDLAPLV